MKKRNIIVDKSFIMAIEIVNLYKSLINTHSEYVMSKQILRSGTSVGANIREAVAGFSKADFKAKMSIAHKEASETEYWLELLFKTDFLDEEHFTKIFTQVREVNKIISKILISS